MTEKQCWSWRLHTDIKWAWNQLSCAFNNLTHARRIRMSGLTASAADKQAVSWHRCIHAEWSCRTDAQGHEQAELSLLVSVIPKMKPNHAKDPQVPSCAHPRPEMMPARHGEERGSNHSNTIIINLKSGCCAVYYWRILMLMIWVIIDKAEIRTFCNFIKMNGK